LEVAENILEKADNLFHKFGIRSISMDEIARELGISKKTIYQFFKDKDDIVYKSEDAIDELIKVSLCLRKNLNRINPSLLFDIQKYHSRSWDLWLDYKNNFIKGYVLKSIERGKREGYFRAEIDAETLATFRIEQVQMSFDDRVFPHTKFDFTEVQMALFDHFVHGLLTMKGHKIYEKLIKAQINV
jgi:AcrR family transcriptional regulator